MNAPTAPTGVLVIDKPPGLTSHDVVARVRRKLATRRVGHAGTLDPMATGVLVVMVGEATKLAPYLTSNDKHYRAGVQLGTSTDTLDAEGAVVEQAPLPPWWPHEATERVAAALRAEQARTEQAPPIFSAIKIAGRSAHRLARAGKVVELVPRPVAVRSLELGALTDDGRLSVDLRVSKGYYVRAFARDLGAALGTPAHLASLRRLASGGFTLEGAHAPEDVTGDDLIPLAAAAARGLGTAHLTEEGAVRARRGALLGEADFVAPPARGVDGEAWLDPRGGLVAIGARDATGRPVVKRVFNADTAPTAPRG